MLLLCCMMEIFQCTKFRKFPKTWQIKLARIWQSLSAHILLFFFSGSQVSRLVVYDNIIGKMLVPFRGPGPLFLSGSGSAWISWCKPLWNFSLTIGFPKTKSLIKPLFLRWVPCHYNFQAVFSRIVLPVVEVAAHQVSADDSPEFGYWEQLWHVKNLHVVMEIQGWPPLCHPFQEIMP